jgi:hypothetical protein
MFSVRHYKSIAISIIDANLIIPTAKYHAISIDTDICTSTHSIAYQALFVCIHNCI